MIFNKKIIIIVWLLSIAAITSAQDVRQRLRIIENIGSLYKTKTEFKTEIEILQSINDSISHFPSRVNDSIVKVNKKRIEAYNKGVAGIEIDIDSLNKILDNSPIEKSYKERKKFRSHYSGVFVGLNTFFNKDGELNKPNEDFMKLNTGRSIDLDIFFAKTDISFSKTNGLSLGLDWKINHYSLGNDFNLEISDDNQLFITQNLKYSDVKRHNLRLMYMYIPILYEIQASSRNSFYFNCGFSGGVQIGARTKQIAANDDNRKKITNRNDFDTYLFRYNFMAGIGCHGLEVFSMFSPQKIFKTNSNPTLYPFEIGVKISLY